MDNVDEIIDTNKINKNKKWKVVLISFFSILIIFLFLSAPFSSKDIVIHIKDGDSVDYVAQELHNKNIIRNEFVLKLFIKILKSGQGVVSGDYLIFKNSSVWEVALQVGRGYHNIKPIKITIREGLTNIEIANLLSGKLSVFKIEDFLSKVEDKQGYLFPDTYFLFPLDTTDEIINKLSNNFYSRTKKINSYLAFSNKNLSSVVIMASILEGEANGKEDIGIISGILWKRISIGMPLQVDIEKSTYTSKGLPVKPLNNPGLSSIEAAVNPIDSVYLYYLHDKNGNVHYAKTFEEHKRNINNYLK
ncbi:MAG: endolytic transglycosylase MltG [Candidatus Nomurabacteria bacterium]|nr:endolytic transglycosylase MltG [Candidatus Nomurabacteria bacterium]